MINSVNHNSFDFDCLLFSLCSVLYGAKLWGVKQAVTHGLKAPTLFSEKIIPTVEAGIPTDTACEGEGRPPSGESTSR